VRAGALLLVAVALIGWRSGESQEMITDSAVAKGRRRFWVRPVASFLVPGSGQVLARQDRAAIYIGTEVYALTRFIQLTVSSHRDASRFRDIAFQVARSAFAPMRRDTVFEYFETMQRYMESGQFDLDPGPAFAPEVDTTTYNGSVWMTARRTYWPDPNMAPALGSPAYARAVQFYETHAVGPGYLWSWNNSEQQLTEFKETIQKSDNAFRRAQDQVGILLANHLVSAVDAFISSRLSNATHRATTLRSVLSRTDAFFTLSVAF
jgi:hypothetical protein